jgi:hypothetical protein
MEAPAPQQWVSRHGNSPVEYGKPSRSTGQSGTQEVSAPGQ